MVRPLTTGSPPERAYSPREEFSNALSAAAGLAGTVILAPLLVTHASRGMQAAAVVFAACLVALHLASTVYHFAPPGRTKDRLRVLDHCAIYLLIAGTYTPFAAGPLRDHGGAWLLAMVWALAALGIGFKLFGGMRRRRFSNAIYLGMGWIGLLWFPALFRVLPSAAMYWLLAGGAAYTLGVPFYASRRRPYCHFVWHLFVLAGSACHAWAVWRYAL